MRHAFLEEPPPVLFVDLSGEQLARRARGQIRGDSTQLLFRGGQPSSDFLFRLPADALDLQVGLLRKRGALGFPLGQTAGADLHDLLVESDHPCVHLRFEPRRFRPERLRFAEPLLAFAEEIEADAYCRDAAVAVETAKKLIAIKRAQM